MAIEDYWASTARNAKDVAQYLIYPLTKMASLMLFKDSHRADLAAGIATTTFYTGLGGLFMGREMDGFDKMMRMALAAEQGKRPEEIKFSDYYDSKNDVIKTRMALFSKENVNRYPVGVLPLLPVAMEHITRKVSPHSMEPTHSSLAEGETRWRDDKPKPNSPAIEHFLHGWNLWDTAVYGGIAVLWLHETFGVDKTFAYQGRKEMENTESIALKIGANNIAGLFNRMRSDSKTPMIEDKRERDMIWPLFEQLADKMNTSQNYNIAALAYLMGLGKLDVFAKNTQGEEIKDSRGLRVIDPQAWANAQKEIEIVDKIGLAGIAEQKRMAKMQPDKIEKKHPVSFVNKLGRDWMDFQFNSFQSMVGGRKKFNEDISPRDPGEVPMSMG